MRYASLFLHALGHAKGLPASDAFRGIDFVTTAPAENFVSAPTMTAYVADAPL